MAKKCTHPNGGDWGPWTNSLTEGVEHRTKKCRDCGHAIDSQQRPKP